MFFDDWHSVLRILIVGALAYLGLILLLRISGKRTLSQLNVFDFVVTVAFGSTLATTLLSKDTALFEGLTALALLILLQFAVATLSLHFNWAERLVKSAPRFLYRDGRYLEEAMRKERIRKEEILQAARSQGMAGLEQVHAVVLETNGKLSVIRRSDSSDTSALQNVGDPRTPKSGALPKKPKP
jgi:uncharacterized membrane protein YcaP (DUF421 family)